MSLLPEDDEPLSLLPPEEDEETPELFVDGGGNIDWEERKKIAIPKYNNLLPKKVIAKPITALAWVISLGFFAFYFWQFYNYIGGDFGKYSSDFTLIFTDLWETILAMERNDLFLFIMLGAFMIILIGTANFLEGKVSKCPVCGKKNYSNYHVCQKCDYIFYSRDIINKEILSVKLNNLDYSPEQVREEFLDRRLADLNPSYIKSVLVKNHFL